MKKLCVVALLLLSVAGCGKATKNYPDPLPGWHNPDYSVVYGRLLRVPSKKPENPAVWVIRYDLANDRYGGEFALAPPERLTGYSGGEPVEIRGSIRRDVSQPDYSGTWYQVQSIKMWSNYH